MDGNYGPTRGLTFDAGLSCRFVDFEDSDTPGSVSTNGSCSSNNGEDSKMSVKLFQHSIPNHLLVVALIEHICSLYYPDHQFSKQLFKALCSQLSAMKLVPAAALLDEFQSIRDTFRTALDDFILLAVDTLYSEVFHPSSFFSYCILMTRALLLWKFFFILLCHEIHYSV